MVATKFAVAARDRFMRFLFDSGTHLFSTEQYVSPFMRCCRRALPERVAREGCQRVWSSHCIEHHCMRPKRRSRAMASKVLNTTATLISKGEK